ncbi:aspartate aminotransferase family protein [Pandoraea sp. XJJ-1]|uniref:aspartate aminotransferase family protein n=1 Tax=Pandoraea sp. XJJ-1 TaxID=3002643 RepID=UPI00227F40F8|nr:aspartate aminotransferase family protein [Pandoraea sp. XJJ-1]WAL81264.1 aspartate aminotransferase family protein [Pandoraea sp. XJJ-1]
MTVAYPSDDSHSRKLFERAQHYLPGGNTRTTVFMKPYPIYAVRGKGCRVWDADGVARIDCINNFTSQIHGYAHPAINEVIHEQIELGTAFGMPTASEIELASLLCDRVASIDAVRFMNSGTEAVMMALKAARAYTGRAKIAKVEGAYHGSYDYSEVSLDSTPANWGDAHPASVAYAAGTPRGVTDDVIVLPFNDPDGARRLIHQHGADLAAVLVDPMPNRAGLVPASIDYLRAIREAVDEVGALLIFDEVISFRLGYHGAQPLWGVSADLTTLGKVIGGGFPVGAVGGRRDIMEVFSPIGGKPALPHGGTFSANPITMRAGVAALKLLDHAAFRHLDAIGDSVRDGLRAALIRHGVPGKVVGRGSLLKVHFTERDVMDYRSAFADATEARRLETFNRGLLNRGVLAASYGLMALSTAMNGDDVAEIVAAMEGAVEDVQRLG